MTDETTALLSLGSTVVSGAKGDEYRARAKKLAELISDFEDLAKGKSFADLSLYEKKSVLVNHELE